jgi:outer membrane protein assembly factor BamB
MITLKNTLFIEKYFTIILILLFILTFQAFSQEKNAVPVWRAALGGMMMGNPVSQVESVAVILDSGNLCSYSRQGNLLWNYYSGGKLGPFISRSREGTSYISRTNGIFIAVNRAGKELWRKSLGETLAAPVIVGWDGRIFVPTEKKLFCYTVAGYLLWQKNFDSPLVFGPEKDLQGGIILGLDGGIILHINHFGEMRTFQLSENPALVVPVLTQNLQKNDESSLIKEEKSSQSELKLISAAQNGELIILGEENRDISLPSLPEKPLQAISRNGNIAFSLQNSKIVFLSNSFLQESFSESAEKTNNQSFLWTNDTQNLSKSSIKSLDMIYDERGIYVVSIDGASGFTEDGRRLWIINIQGSAAMTAFSDEGLLYSGGSNWILYAYRLEERILGTKQSVYGPAPEGSYGLGNPAPSSWDGYHFRNEEAEIRRELKSIEETILSGRTSGGEAEYTAYLMELASSAVANAGRKSPVQVSHRVQALQLLSYIGSRETIPFLVNLFDRDPDPAVQAAAAKAIGKIGVDPEGIALKAFSLKIYSTAAQRNEQVLNAVVEASASLCRFSGPPLSDAVIKLLILLGNSTMPLSVRTNAEKELTTLR